MNFNIKTAVIKSVKWTALSEITSHSIQPIVTLILARLLTPADFGVVGVAMIAIGLAQIFQDFGLGKTLIQRETEVEKCANIVFWTNLTLSIVIYIIIFLTAPFLSKFFHEPKVINVLRVLSLQIILLSFIVAHRALFQRNFQFKQLFFIQLSSSAVRGLVSISLALLGYGVWALVFGSLAGAFVQILLFWKFSQWRPNLSYDVQLAKQLFAFSIWIVLEAFLIWIILWGDSLILGHFLGVKEMGIYRVGVTVLTLVFGIFFNPLLPVAYSAFSRLQSNQDELKQLFLKLTKMIAFISLPLGVNLVILSKPISLVIFGQKWSGIEVVIAILGIKEAISWLVGLNPEIYRAVGRPDINTKLLISAVIYYLPIYFLAAPYGLLVFCISRLAVTIVAMGLHIFVANRILGLKFTYLGGCIKEPLFGSLVIVIVLYLISYFIGEIRSIEGLFKIFGTVSIGATVYIASLWLLRKELVLRFWELVKEEIISVFPNFSKEI
jgi:O-antigen/teichoic acid export membrane protein